MDARVDGGRTLERHDASDLIGLRVAVAGAVREYRESDGEVSHEIPDIQQLANAAAVVRCLMPFRIRGSELRAIRKIADWTAVDLAQKLGEKTSPETVSRWENEKQPMGGYAEKVFRLVVCEALHAGAPGVEYRAGMLADLVVIDPWRADPEFVVPEMVFDRVKMRDDDRKLVETWEPEELPRAA